jgi:hypothetical protein
MRLPAAALVVLVALGAATASGRAVSHVLIPGCSGSDRAAYKPATVIIACGDGNFRIERLSWTSWNSTGAAGKGTGKVNTCTPNCAQGKFKSYKVKLTAHRPVACANGKREFSRLTYKYTGKHPSGTPRSGTVARPCSK